MSAADPIAEIVNLPGYISTHSIARIAVEAAWPKISSDPESARLYYKSILEEDGEDALRYEAAEALVAAGWNADMVRRRMS